MPVDQGEFEVLYRTHYARLIRLCCLWLDDPHEAEDVVQEVLLKLLKVSQSPYRPTAWEPWLTRVTRNACHDRQRSDHRPRCIERLERRGLGAFLDGRRRHLDERGLC